MRVAIRPAFPLSRRRWATIVLVTVLAAVLAAVQHTPWAPLPRRHTSTLAGIATGCAVMAALLRVAERRALRGRGARPA